MGIAVGGIGMSHDDFCKCTFAEFESICKAWSDMREADHRDAWERARIIAVIGIQPHIRKRITPQQLLPLPWDKKPRRRHEQTPGITADDRLKRFEELTKRI